MTKSGRSNTGSTLWFNSPNQVLSTSRTNEYLSKLARCHLDLLTEAGWQAAGRYIADCFASGDFRPLCLYDPDVMDLQATDQYHIGQCLAFFKKRVDIDLGIDREAVAREKFRAAELACKLTNQTFVAWNSGRFQFRPEVERVLHASQLKISSLLGDVPLVRDLRPRFGPGASTQVQKRDACSLLKLTRIPACSTNLSNDPELPVILGSVWPAEADTWVDVPVHTSRLSFVPKNAKTERAICTEPALNSMFQLGIGDYMAQRLRTVGIDIRDQSANQRAALYGSISRELATLDLSSASDTIALKLVEHLLPEEWYDLLAKFRTAEMRDGDRITALEKISSMGNGFTFPLETLIFWAIAQSVVDLHCPRSQRRTLVYGDDIVVPVAAAEPLMAVLRDLGFTPNPEKSFWARTCVFRESCGKDYVSGIDIRPVFVTEPLGFADVYVLHNYYFARGMHHWCRLLRNTMEPTLRRHGPSGLGDGHFHSQVWISRPAGKRKGWSGYTFETWASRPRELRNVLSQRYARKHKRGWEFSPASYSVVRRLATYLAYSREQSLEDRLGYLEPNPDYRWETVPGDGPLHLMKVYTFEPPSLN